MNFLSSSYQDASYRQYLDIAPLLAVCVVGKERDQIRQALLQAEGDELKFCLSFADSMLSLKSKTVKDSPLRVNKGLLKTDWCLKHQRDRFGTILVVDSWEQTAKGEPSQKLSKSLADAQSYLSTVNSRVVVSFLTSSDTAPVNSEQLSAVSAGLKELLGRNFHSAVIVSFGPDLERTAANLRREVRHACAAYHKDEIRRLHESKKMLATSERDDSAAGAIVRNHFKTGWHYLVIRDYFGARKHMNKAYKIVRTLFPKFAAMEARVCASIILQYSVSLAPHCGEDISYATNMRQEIIGHIEWLGHAFTAEYSHNCSTLLRSIRSFLTADWYILLARKTQNVSSAARRDFFFAAASCLAETLSDLPEQTKERQEIPPPPFVGTECANDAYADLIMSTISKGQVCDEICSLLHEGCSVTAASGTRRRECNFIEFHAKCLANCGSEMFGTDEIQNCLAQDWRSESIATLLCTAVIFHPSANYQSLLYACVHGVCAPFPDAEVKNLFSRRLSEVPHENARLEYPNGNLSSPLAVTPAFSSAVCEFGRGRTAVKITLHSSAPFPVRIEEAAALLTNGEGEIPLQFEAKSVVVQYSDKLPTILEEEVTFTGIGNYYCTSFTSTITILGHQFTFVQNFPRLERSSRHARNYEFGFPSQNENLVHVVMPKLLATLDFPDGDHITCVEGESINIPFTIGALREPLQNCFLEMPRPTAYFCGALRCGASNTPLVPLEVPTNSEVVSYSVDDLVNNTTEYLFCGKGIRSGIYTVPICFRYSASGVEKISTKKIVRITVNPPFDAQHSYIATTTRQCEVGQLHVPDAETEFTHKEKNILITSRSCSSSASLSGVVDDEAKKISLFYTVAEDQKITTAAPGKSNFVSPIGEPILIQSRLSCSAHGGLIVRKVDVVCVDGVDVLYTSAGDLPCHLDEGEVAAVVAKIRVTATQKLISPGFVRVLFSPASSNVGDQLMADFPLPAISIGESSWSLSYKYPTVVTAGTPFDAAVYFRNEYVSPFIGDAVLRLRGNDFIVSGRNRWKLDVAPGEACCIHVTLIPMVCGVLQLPVIQLREGTRPVGNGGALSTYLVSVIPATQQDHGNPGATTLFGTATP